MPVGQTVLDRIHEINLDMLREFDAICRRHGIPYQLGYGGLLGAVRHKDFIPWDNDVDVMMMWSDYEKLFPYLEKEADPALYETLKPSFFGNRYFDMVPRLIYKKARIRMDEGYVSYYRDKSNRIGLDIFLLAKAPAGIRGKIFACRLAFLYGLLNGKRYQLELEHYSGAMKAVALILRGMGKGFSAERLRKRVEKVCKTYEGKADATHYRITNETLHDLMIDIEGDWVEKTTEVPIKGEMFMAPAGYDPILKAWYGDYMKLPPVEERTPHWGKTPINEENFIFED